MYISMLRLKFISHLPKALYHDARNESSKRLQRQPIQQGYRKTKMPTIRYASDIERGNLKRMRLNSETASMISPYEETKTTKEFKPFPYLIDENNKAEVSKRLFTPLHDVPYSKQLSLKEEQCRKFLRILAKDLIASGTNVRLDVSHLPCPVRPIVAAPVQRNYKSLEDLSIWTGINGKPTLGLFAFKQSQHGNTIALDTLDLELNQDNVKNAVKVLQNLIDSRKNFPIFYPSRTENGYRRFEIRSNLKDELLVMTSFNPANLLEKELEDEKYQFREEILSKFNEAGLQLNGVGFQTTGHSTANTSEFPYENLYGRDHLDVTVNDFNLRMSMNNPYFLSLPNASTFYSAIEQSINQCFPIVRNNRPVVVNLTSCNNMLDFHLSRYGSRVIGLNPSADSVLLANEDAKTNNVENIKFEHAGHRFYDDVVAEVLSKTQQEMMVIIELPKYGNYISHHIIDIVRSCKRITKVVFLSGQNARCNEILMRFCSNRRDIRGLPFVPVSAYPLDQAPQLPKCQLLTMLERSQ